MPQKTPFDDRILSSSELVKELGALWLEHRKLLRDQEKLIAEDRRKSGLLAALNTRLTDLSNAFSKYKAGNEKAGRAHEQ